MNDTRKTLVAEIARETIAQGEAIYYAGDGVTQRGSDGCQPSNTTCLVTGEGAGEGAQVDDLGQWDAAAALDAIEEHDASVS